MSIFCRFNKHKFMERKRVEIEKLALCQSHSNGSKIPNTEFNRITYIVIEECGRDDICKVQKAYKVTCDEQLGKSKEINREQIHIDMAKELIFVAKL